MMKKLIYIFSAAALLCGCEQTDVIEQLPGGRPGDSTAMELPEVIYATTDGDNDPNGEQKSDTTKTHTVVAEDGKSILWNTGDAVSASFSGSSNAKTSTMAMMLLLLLILS